MSEEKTVILDVADPKAPRTFRISEPLLRAMLLSHLLTMLPYVEGYLNEFEDIKYDKESKMVTFKFKKSDVNG